MPRRRGARLAFHSARAPSSGRRTNSAHARRYTICARRARSSRAADLWLVCKLLPHYSSPEAQRGDASAAVEAFVLRMFAADCLTPTPSVAQKAEAARNPFCLGEGSREEGACCVQRSDRRPSRPAGGRNPTKRESTLKLRAWCWCAWARRSAKPRLRRSSRCGPRGAPARRPRAGARQPPRAASSWWEGLGVGTCDRATTPPTRVRHRRRRRTTSHWATAAS